MVAKGSSRCYCVRRWHSADHTKHLHKWLSSAKPHQQTSTAAAAAVVTSASANSPMVAPSASPYSLTNLWNFTSAGGKQTGSTNLSGFHTSPPTKTWLPKWASSSSREGRGGPGTADVKFAIAIPVYVYDAGKVQVLQITQKSILKEIDAISQLDDYSNLLDWDFSVSKKGSGLTTEYSVRPVPRKKGSQEFIDAAWLEAKSDGFDISRLLEGTNPFKPA